MKNEVTETSSNRLLQPVTRQDLQAMQAQREVLKEFISSQLREAQFKDSYAADYGDGDFGVIPGTKKKTLLKPGAEKLLRLFGLGVRFKLVDKEVDRDANFASYTYEAEVYHLKSGSSIANCMGTANSQEVKYRERTVWRKNAKGIKESVKEETPIFDVINTLSKMAQKRALIGATIIATAASDFFTQDMEPDEVLTETPEREAKKVEPESAPQAETQASAEEPPVHCGRPMMLSKFPNRETGAFDWYCLRCKAKVPRGEG